MPVIQVPDDIYRRVEEFRSVARAVMDEDVDTPACLGIILALGFKAGLNEIMQKQEESILALTIQQLAERDPKLVCEYVAEMVALGADIHAQENKRGQIGFLRISKSTN